MKKSGMRLNELKKEYLENEGKRRKQRNRKQSDWLDCEFPSFNGHAQNRGLGIALKGLAYGYWL